MSEGVMVEIVPVTMIVGSGAAAVAGITQGVMLEVRSIPVTVVNGVGAAAVAGITWGVMTVVRSITVCVPFISMVLLYDADAGADAVAVACITEIVQRC